MAIVKPEQMNFSEKNIIMIISGLPGTGKTTLALSAPDVVLVDADEGIVRVNPNHRKDCSMCKTYEEFLTDIESFKGVYKTVIIDTMGAMIEYMKDWAMRTDKAACKRGGGFSQQGFGIVKSEFMRLSSELKKHFNVIFLFHVSKGKNGDDIFYDLVCEGSAKTLVWQPADLGAYLHIMNGERYLGFTPTANYNAKAAYGIKGLVKVPELGDGDKNDFFERLFGKVKAYLKEENNAFAMENALYNEAIRQGTDVISKINGVDDIENALEKLGKMQHALTSKKEIAAILNSRLAELKIKKNPLTKKYEQVSDDNQLA